jgi:ribosomal-protein-alanine N-acetyltransferase
MQSPPPRSDIPTLTAMNLVIDTPRLRLRPISLDDVEGLWPYVSDPALPRLMSWDAHKDRGETRAYIASQIDALAKGTDLAWTIVHQGKPGGSIGLHGITWGFHAWRVDRAELGYWLAPPLWGRGLMSEAALAATRWAFQTLGLHKVTVGHIEGNEASKRIIEKLGFRHLSVFEEDAWRDGRWLRHPRYEMTAGEWAALRAASPTVG